MPFPTQLDCEKIHWKRACRESEMVLIIQTCPLTMLLRLFHRASKNRRLLGKHDQVSSYPQTMGDRAVEIWFLGIFDFLRISSDNARVIRVSQKRFRWRAWGEYLTHVSPWASHSQPCTATRQPPHPDSCSVLLVAFRKQHFLDSICKLYFVFLLQNNLHHRNSSICQSWPPHSA